MADALDRYWAALARADGEAMARAYTPDAHFQDPAFDVHGEEVGRMWRALMAQDGISIQTEPLARAGEGAVGCWVATYTFPPTGRRVVNPVTSRFTLRDGKIAVQRDSFSFWRWSRQALGWPGWLLGWTPLVRRRVRRMASRLVR